MPTTHKKYTEEQVWNLIKQLNWSSAICDHEPCYGQMTIQVALHEDMPYLAEFVQDADDGVTPLKSRLHSFVFYTEESNWLTNQTSHT